MVFSDTSGQRPPSSFDFTILTHPRLHERRQQHDPPAGGNPVRHRYRLPVQMEPQLAELAAQLPGCTARSATDPAQPRGRCRTPPSRTELPATFQPVPNLRFQLNGTQAIALMLYNGHDSKPTVQREPSFGATPGNWASAQIDQEVGLRSFRSAPASVAMINPTVANASTSVTTTNAQIAASMRLDAACSASVHFSAIQTLSPSIEPQATWAPPMSRSWSTLARSSGSHQLHVDPLALRGIDRRQA
jgi:hypothetical protein